MYPGMRGAAMSIEDELLEEARAEEEEMNGFFEVPRFVPATASQAQTQTSATVFTPPRRDIFISSDSSTSLVSQPPATSSSSATPYPSVLAPAPASQQHPPYSAPPLSPLSSYHHPSHPTYPAAQAYPPYHPAYTNSSAPSHPTYSPAQEAHLSTFRPSPAPYSPKIPTRSLGRYKGASSAGSHPSAIRSTTSLYGSFGRTLPPVASSSSSALAHTAGGIPAARRRSSRGPEGPSSSTDSQLSIYSDPGLYSLHSPGAAPFSLGGAAAAAAAGGVDSSRIRLAPWTFPSSLTEVPSSQSPRGSPPQADVPGESPSAPKKQRSSSSMRISEPHPPAFASSSAWREPAAMWRGDPSCSSDRLSLNSLARESVDEEMDAGWMGTTPEPVLPPPRRLMSKSDDGWRYELTVVQQPVRARACGFSDKDRRSLSPTPIVMLSIFDRENRPIPTLSIPVHFLVLAVDLWSADGVQEKNHVLLPSARALMAAGAAGPPSHGASSRERTESLSPSQTTPLPVVGWEPGKGASTSSRPSSQTSEPGRFSFPPLDHSQAKSMDWTDSHFASPDPMAYRDRRRQSSLSSVATHALSYFSGGPDRRDSASTQASSFIDPNSGWQSSASSDHRPSTSSDAYPSPGGVHPLVAEMSTFGLDSPALGYAKLPPLGSLSSAAHSASASTSSLTLGGLEAQQQQQHPNTPLDGSSRVLPPLPPTPLPPVLGPPAPVSRALAGGLVTTAERLVDPQGALQVFFFGHEVSARLEGTYRLKFTLVRTDKTDVLATVLSEPFTVYSGKKFPGQLEPSELTKHFIAQGVKLPTRRRKESAASDSD